MVSVCSAQKRHSMPRAAHFAGEDQRQDRAGALGQRAHHRPRGLRVAGQGAHAGQRRVRDQRHRPSAGAMTSITSPGTPASTNAARKALPAMGSTRATLLPRQQRRSGRGRRVDRLRALRQDREHAARVQAQGVALAGRAGQRLIGQQVERLLGVATQHRRRRLVEPGRSALHGRHALRQRPCRPGTLAGDQGVERRPRSPRPAASGRSRSRARAAAPHEAIAGSAARRPSGRCPTGPRRRTAARRPRRRSCCG